MNQTIKYLFSDMDGTLLNSQKKVSGKNIRAIRHFTEQGGHFAVATGRSPEITLPFLDNIPITSPCILFNGAGIYDFSTSSFLHKEYLPDHIVEKITDLSIKEYPQICIEAFEEGPIQLLNPDCILDHYIVEEQQPYIFTSAASNTRYMKLLLYADPKILPNVFQKLLPVLKDTVSFTFSSPFYLEILPLGVSKGTALQWICKNLAIAQPQTAAIGDFDNDKEILRFSALGAAPQNASPLAKEAADVIVPSNDEHCVEFFLKHHILV